MYRPTPAWSVLVFFLLVFVSSASAEDPPYFALSWGGSGSGDGQFANCYGSVIDASGNLYVVDRFNHRVQKFQPDGTFLMSFGAIGSADGEFNNPFDIDIDGAGNLYVADYFNNRVQRFDADGTFIDSFGGPGSGDGQLSGPAGVVVDGSGNVYVTEIVNARVQKFDSGGNFLLKWGSAGSGDGQFSEPRGIDQDSMGNIYVVEAGNHRLQKFDSSGGFLLKWGTSGAGDGQFSFPIGVDIDAEDGIHVSDYQNDRVQKFTAAGAFVWKVVPGAGQGCAAVSVGADGVMYVSNYDANLIYKYVPNPPLVEAAPDYLGQWGTLGSATGEFNIIRGMALDSQRDLYVCDRDNNRMQKFDEDGNLLFVFGSPGSAVGQFLSTHGVATDDVDDVYVADGGNNRIQKFDSDGTFLLTWGSTGSAPGQFGSPVGVAVGPDGSVYVADAGNHRIQRFDASGTFLLEWGSHGIGDGQFAFPWGIAVNGAGETYVADNNNSRIQKFDANGVFLSKWGSGGTANGQFSQPSDVAMTPDGDVLVADQGNNRVQKFDGAGNFLTAWGTGGSGDGEFSFPFAAEAHPDGSVYVADASNHRVQKFGLLAPTITTVDDIAADQGLQVRVTFARSGRDFVNSLTPIVQYDVFRRIDPPSALSLQTAAGEVTLARPLLPTSVLGSPISILRDEGWDFVGSSPASGQNEYNVVVPTLGDSTGAGIHWSTFFCRAATAAPTGYFDSAPDSGYSIDDLVPPVPPAPLVEEGAGGLVLDWDPSPAPDFFYFGVYRDADPGFVPASPQDFYAVTTEPAYVDGDVEAGETWYYRLAAFDDAENFSGYSDAAGSPVTTDGPHIGAPHSFALLPNTPNPFRSSTSFHFSLAKTGPVTLRIYDVRGARVRTVIRETRAAGIHVVSWDGRDDDGSPIASGVFLYELETEGKKLVRKLNVTR